MGLMMMKMRKEDEEEENGAVFCQVPTRRGRAHGGAVDELKET